MKKSEVTSGSKYKIKPKRPEQPYKKIVAMTAGLKLEVPHGYL
jgi:hypothetical protein